MKNVILIFFLLILSACAKVDIVHFMNDFEIIGETHNTEPTLSARILKLREFGECDNKKCPKEKVFIAISEFGEYPDQNVFQTKPSEKWEFVAWEYIPKLEDKTRLVKFKIKSINNRKETLYRVIVDLNNIRYEKLTTE